MLLPDLCSRQLHQAGAVAVVALARLQRGSRNWCLNGATEPRRTPLKASESETTLEARAVNFAKVVLGHGSACRISVQTAPACMVKVFPDACPKIRRKGLLLTVHWVPTGSPSALHPEFHTRGPQAKMVQVAPSQKASITCCTSVRLGMVYHHGFVVG